MILDLLKIIDQLIVDLNIKTILINIIKYLRNHYSLNKIKILFFQTELID
jgi:hypothetical protein